MAKKLKTIKIIDTIYPNIGIGTYGSENQIMHVKGAIVGQIVEAIPGRIRDGYRDGKIYSVLEKSHKENYEGCVHRELCGGCVYQSMSYEDEINYKEEQIRKLFKTIGIKIQKSVKSPDFKSYRNKMEYTFGDEYKGSPMALGMHKKNRFYEIVNTKKCLIVHEDFNIIRRETRDYLESQGLNFLHKMSREGNLRHLVIRRSEIGEILINLVITSDTEINKEALINFFLSLELEGEIKSVFITYNDSLADAVIPENVEHIYGKEFIIEKLNGLEFKITPFSFFQTNTKSAEVLYNEGIGLLENIDDKIIFDLYSGTGTITQILGKKAKKVIGIEIIEEAVESAKRSAIVNKIENVEFIAGDVLEEVEKIDIKPDIIVIDPPREGIHPKAILKIINFKPEQFLYISCNPKTMVRDLEIFMGSGYHVQNAIMIDQFPRTSHVECIALIQKKTI